MPLAESVQCRLVGTRGSSSAVGEIVKLENGVACWKMHPHYAAWFWPLMSRVTELVLQLPESMLEPLQPGDNTAAPPPPSEDEKRTILRLKEKEADCARVYTLQIHGKSPLIRKAFPTRLANLAILRRHRRT